MTFAEKLRAERKRIGLTQAKLDELLGLGKGQTTAWETSRNTPHEIMQEGVLDRLKREGKSESP